MREAVRVAVMDAAFCVNRDCGYCQKSLFTGAVEFADCRREMCDNHRRGPAPLPPLVSDTPPFELPAPGSTHPLE